MSNDKKRDEREELQQPGSDEQQPQRQSDFHNGGGEE
jgi:hypothetical protein